jgi:hypothetical protein
LKNFPKTLNMALATLASFAARPPQACLPNVHYLEREDLVALAVEAAAMAKIPLAGTNWIR